MYLKVREEEEEYDLFDGLMLSLLMIGSKVLNKFKNNQKETEYSRPGVSRCRKELTFLNSSRELRENFSDMFDLEWITIIAQRSNIIQFGVVSREG